MPAHPLVSLPAEDPAFTQHREGNTRLVDPDLTDFTAEDELLLAAHARLLDVRDRINITAAKHVVYALSFELDTPQDDRDLAAFLDALADRSAERAAVIIPNRRTGRSSAWMLPGFERFHGCGRVTDELKAAWQHPHAGSLSDSGRHPTAGRTFAEYGITDPRP